MLAVTWEQVSPVVYILLVAALSSGGSLVVESHRQRQAKAEHTREWQRTTLVELHEAIAEVQTIGLESIYRLSGWRDDGGEEHRPSDERPSRRRSTARLSGRPTAPQQGKAMLYSDEDAKPGPILDEWCSGEEGHEPTVCASR